MRKALGHQDGSEDTQLDSVPRMGRSLDIFIFGDHGSPDIGLG